MSFYLFQTQVCPELQGMSTILTSSPGMSLMSPVFLSDITNVLYALQICNQLRPFREVSNDKVTALSILMFNPNCR